MSTWVLLIVVYFAGGTESERLGGLRDRQECEVAAELAKARLAERGYRAVDTECLPAGLVPEAPSSGGRP